jgi:hypothetical protein
MNNTFRDIGYLLIDNMSYKLDDKKLKLLDKVNKYNITKKEHERKKQENREYYVVKYEEPRTINKQNYDDYLQQKLYLYNVWKDSKNIKDLHQYISFARPEYIEVPDVYTSQFDFKIIK